MKKNVSLRTFLILVVVLGAITGLTWEYWLLNPVRVEQVVMGQVTSGEQCSTRPLTVAELEWAVKRQIKTKSTLTDDDGDIQRERLRHRNMRANQQPHHATIAL